MVRSGPCSWRPLPGRQFIDCVHAQAACERPGSAVPASPAFQSTRRCFIRACKALGWLGSSGTRQARLHWRRCLATGPAVRSALTITRRCKSGRVLQGAQECRIAARQPVFEGQRHDDVRMEGIEKPEELRGYDTSRSLFGSRKMRTSPKWFGFWPVGSPMISLSSSATVRSRCSWRRKTRWARSGSHRFTGHGTECGGKSRPGGLTLR